MSSAVRVPFDELDVADCATLTWQGRPFTGVAYETNGPGELISEAAFVDGLQTGITREWFESRALRAEAEYAHGSRHGRSRTWHANGQLASEARYQYGIKTEEKTRGEDGSLMTDWSLPEQDEGWVWVGRYARWFGDAP